MTRILQKANLEGATSFISPAELMDMLNVSGAEWYDIVRLSTFGGQYYRSSTTFSTSTTNTTGSYPLPADFLAEISVDAYITPSQVITCRPFQEEERNRFKTFPVGWLYGRVIYYQLQAGNIVFSPLPEASYQVTINYVPVFTQLTSDSSSLDSINGWEEWIVLDCAIKALVKDGQTDMIPFLEQQKAQQRMRIEAAAPNRDMNGAEVVHDVLTIYGGGDFGID